MLNYLKETLSFLDAVQKDPLSPRAQVLWHYLLYFNNQAAIALDNGDYYWPVWFTVDNGVLAKVMGLKDSKRLYDVRNQLIQRGWLRYHSGKGAGLPSVYRNGYRPDDRAYALTPFTPGFEETLVFPKALPKGIPVWANKTEVESAGLGKPSIYNKYININTRKNRIEPPTAIAPSTCPNPFDEIAERGRQAALRRVTDEDMKQYFQTKEEP